MFTSPTVSAPPAPFAPHAMPALSTTPSMPPSPALHVPSAPTVPNAKLLLNLCSLTITANTIMKPDTRVLISCVVSGGGHTEAKEANKYFLKLKHITTVHFSSMYSTLFTRPYCLITLTVLCLNIRLTMSTHFSETRVGSCPRSLFSC